jgi:hypothetical protein
MFKLYDRVWSCRVWQVSFLKIFNTYVTVNNDTFPLPIYII